MSAGERRVTATFWLLDAPDSIREQSRVEQDGYGLGTFDEAGRPVVDKSPVAAWEDARFAADARERCSRTFVAHVRYASTGSVAQRNTHPFELDGRLFAHNGVVEGLDRIEAALGDDLALVRGDTDSERVFALVTREIRRAGGDIGAGIAQAVDWIAGNVPLLALNFVLTTPDELWALRLPAAHPLLLLDRRAGGDPGTPPAPLRGDAAHGRPNGRLRVASDELQHVPGVLVATEALDDDPGWRPLLDGELVQVRRDGVVVSRVLGVAVAHPLTLAELDERAAASQH
jgi:glutamine amidotransferase